MPAQWHLRHLILRLEEWEPRAEKVWTCCSPATCARNTRSLMFSHVLSASLSLSLSYFCVRGGDRGMRRRAAGLLLNSRQYEIHSMYASKRSTPSRHCIAHKCTRHQVAKGFALRILGCQPLCRLFYRLFCPCLLRL